MKPNTLKAISHATLNRVISNSTLITVALTACAVIAPLYSANAAVIDQTLCLSRMTKTMSDNKNIEFWGFTKTCNVVGNGELPGPLVELGVGDTLNLTLSVPMMSASTPMESMVYPGHTIHLHGADVTPLEDGVPETNGGRVGGDTYTWLPTAKEAGTYMYHCHVHTVKHLEMGMYGPMIVRPVNPRSTGPNDRFLNQLTPDVATAYDFIQTYLLSTVDPDYHTAINDSPVFADYNPQYFLINGKESKTRTLSGDIIVTPSATLATGQNKKVALRLIGLHSVKGTFSILDSNKIPQQFTVHVQDGRQYPTAELPVTSLDIGPAQRFDIIFNTPATTGTWYPQFEYQKMRDSSPGVRAPYANGTVFGHVTF